MKKYDPLEVIGHFQIHAAPVSYEVCTIGHICDTYFVTATRENGAKVRFVLQRMNEQIFKDPPALMHNILSVTEHIGEKLRAAGQDDSRGVMHVIPSLDGKAYYKEGDSDYFRVYTFIENAVNRQSCENEKELYAAAYAFGDFQYGLADFDASELYEVIPNFHNTESRLKDFCAALDKDVCGRAASVQEEIRFVLDRMSYGTRITAPLKEGKLPLRVTHNDTKLNNVMLDPVTGEGVCVIDLDTVMPGSALYDFGDLIRFGASSAAEDERDLSKVYVRTSYYNAARDGFLVGTRGSLTENEIRMLPDGALVITFETGVRFLTDYLAGDTYFKTHYEGQNLDRARNQFKLVRDMEEKIKSGEIR